MIYQKRKYKLNRDIFKQYFQDQPSRKPKKVGFDSNLHRGYFSEFQIVNDRLIATDIRVNFDFDREKDELISKSVIDDVLSEAKACEWFSGTLILFSVPLQTSEEVDYLKMEIVSGKLDEVTQLSTQEGQSLVDYVSDYF